MTNLTLFEFSLGPGKRFEAEVVAETVVPFIRTQHGCKSCEFFADYQTGECGIVVLWDSEKSASAARADAEAVLMGTLAKAGAGESKGRLFEVYEPRMN